MKAKLILSFIASVALSLFIGVAAAQVAQEFNYGINPVVAACAFFTIKTIYFSVTRWTAEGILMAGVNKEIWIDKIKENFFSEYPWLDGCDDWSEWVEFNTINFTLMGSNPVILKNNAVWPIVAAQRTDTNGTITLDTYDSTTTRVRNVEDIEASINKLESVVSQHRRSLTQEIVTEALWNMAPASLALGAFRATGANRAAVIGAQTTVAATLTLQDLATLQERWDALNFPQEGRVLVLNPYHRRDLMAQDVTLFKSFTDLKAGQALDLFGIKVFAVSNTPVYVKSTLAKAAYAAAADNTNDVIASVAFCQREVMKALGSTEMFWRKMETNPEHRADEVGFQQRAKAIPTRTTANYQMAIVSDRA